jgi:hypothetical protein
MGGNSHRELLAAVLTVVILSVTAATGVTAVSAGAASATTTTTTPTTNTLTTTTSVGAPILGLGGAISRPPLVGIQTQASEHGDKGVLLTTNRPPTSTGAPALPGCPDTLDTHLGTGCFYADPGEGSEWVQVLVLNRSDLSPATGVTPYNRDFDCPAATMHPNEVAFDTIPPGYGAPCTKALSDFIGSLNGSDLVIAVSQPGRNPTVQPPVAVGAVLGGVGTNHGIGGPAKWYNSPEHGGNVNFLRGTVSIVGVPGWKTGAVENESATPNVADTGHLDASVAIDSSQQYSPLEGGNAEIETASPITGVLDREGTAWPGDPTELEAIAAIGTKLGLGDNPQAQFYSKAADNNGAYWTAKAAAVRLLHSKEFPELKQGDFEWAQDHLAEQMDWVANVDTYTTAMAMPYSDAQPNLWATFNQIQDQINRDTQNAQGAETTATIFEALTSILEVAGGFGHALHTVSAAVVGAYHLILAFSNVGRAEDEPFSTEAANLAVELTTRLDIVAKEIQIQWRNIIVADYGKLKTVGMCTQVKGKCPDAKDNSDAWQINSDDELAMGDVIKVGLQREVYEKLVPAKYPEAMELNITTAVNYDKNGGAGGWCQPFTPFAGGTGGYLYDQDVQNGFVRPIVLVNNNGDHPASQKVFDSMFAPLNKGEPSKGGLGMNERVFFEHNYGINKSFNSPRWVDAKHWAKYTLCGWLNKT